MVEYEKGWLSKQFDLAKKYFESIPQWKKDMIQGNEEN